VAGIGRAEGTIEGRTNMATTRRQLESPTRRQPKGGAKLDGARGLDQWTTIYQAYNAVFKVAELVLLPQRLSLPQLHLLAILKNGGGILTTGEIGREMVKASQTITGLVDRLEEPGLVERVFQVGDYVEGMVAAWQTATKEERRDLLRMALEAVYVDMPSASVVAVKPKPAFAPLFRVLAAEEDGLNQCLRLATPRGLGAPRN
jgi:hypothetical protein